MTGPDLVPTDVLFEAGRAAPHPDAVTVAVSLFNYEAFIGDCLASVAEQTHAHVELVVVDDHSLRDRSPEAARSWLETHADRFDRLLLLRHRRNRGLAAARNTAFGRARTEFVFVLDADNVIYPRTLRRLQESVRGTRFGAAYSQLELFGAQVELGHADTWSKRRLMRGNYIDAMALVDTRAWAAVGGYTHIEGGWEDFDFWCKFVDHGLAALFVPEILCRYRVHGTSMLRTSTNVATEELKVALTLRHPWLDMI